MEKQKESIIMALLKYEALMPYTMYFVPIRREGWRSFHFKLNGITPFQESDGKVYLMADTLIKIDITDRKNPIPTYLVSIEEVLIEVLKNGAYDNDAEALKECSIRNGFDKTFKKL